MLPDTIRPDCEHAKGKTKFWMKWSRTSPELLLQSESRLLNRLKSRLNGGFISIFGGKSYIRTLIACSVSSEALDKKTPVVLMHGFASGLALWCKNIDSLAAHRPVYAFDLLGFGRSSRPDFPVDAGEAEALFVDSFEEWRSALDLSKFILVGHSFGGYISTSYAINHPEKIAHLILVDPWGFLESPLSEEIALRNSKRSWLARSIGNALLGTNPLSILRAVGPFGRSFIHRVRQDLRAIFDQRSLIPGEFIEIPTVDFEQAAQSGYLAQHLIDSDSLTTDTPFTSLPTVTTTPASNTSPKGDSSQQPSQSLDESDFDGTAALDYVYHMNVQKPSGEIGFRALCTQFGWAKRPMLDRIHLLDQTIPITFIFGSRSWLDMSSGTKTRARRPDCYVDIKIIDGVGHQVYAHAADEFNQYVNLVAKRVDSGDPFKPCGYQKNQTDRTIPARSIEDDVQKQCSLDSFSPVAQSKLSTHGCVLSNSDHLIDGKLPLNDTAD